MSLPLPAIGHHARVAQLKLLHDHWAQIRLGDAAAGDGLAAGDQLDILCLAAAAERPPPQPPPLPLPYILGGFRLHGRPYEIAAWLPGTHPLGCRWWEDLSAWFMVRSVARPWRDDGWQVH